MKTLTKTAAAATLALAHAGATAAHEMKGGEHMDHSGHHPVPPATAQTDTPATKAFRDVDAEMHRNMDIRYSNDVDVDFVRGMIPHHKGAVGMARWPCSIPRTPEIGSWPRRSSRPRMSRSPRWKRSSRGRAPTEPSLPRVV